MSGPDRKTRAEVLHRDEGSCVRCGQVVFNTHSEQPLAQYSLQHRRARGMGGTRNPIANAPENLIVLCGTGTTGCHGWVETHREESRQHGWAISQTEDPALIPVTHHLWGRMWLTRFGYASCTREHLVDRIIRERAVVSGGIEHVALLDWLAAS